MVHLPVEALSRASALLAKKEKKMVTRLAKAKEMEIPMDLAMALAPILVQARESAISLAKLPEEAQDWGSPQVLFVLAHLRDSLLTFEEKLSLAEHRAGLLELSAEEGQSDWVETPAQ